VLAQKSLKALKTKPDMKLIGVSTVQEALEVLFE
jgi:hypothetical protein